VTRGRAGAAVALVAGALAAGVTFGFRGAPAGEVTGTWIGGYQGGSRPVALQVELVQHGSRLSGTAEIGIAQKPVETALRDASVRHGRVTLTLANGTVLEGRSRRGRIAGRRFELYRLRPDPVRKLQRLVGAYRFANGDVVSLFVEPLGTHLRMLEYGTGQMRQLAQVSRDDFLAGPTIRAPWPIQARVQLVRESSGSVVALRRNGRTARRLPLVVEPAGFSSGDVHLVGKLVRPRGAGPFPAVVIVSGSEKATRDTFDLWGMLFASLGFAVLSYDKRGVGESSGRFAATPSQGNLRNLAADVVAGVEWLRGQPEIDPRRIGLTGGSQAGWIIAIAASESSDVRFAAVQSGPAMSVGRERAYAALTGNGSVVPPPTDAQIHAALDGHPDAGFDPKPALAAIHVPVLWQLGGVDKRQYTPETVANLNAIAAQGGHDFTIRVYPTGAHSLRDTKHGFFSEELNAKRFVPGLFPDLAAWLSVEVGPLPSRRS
jgi:dienelactone hydrolase